ncbi:MAG: DUF1800 family protein [Candidatus Krumholzibacteriota bacterium]|nr:DUF1800 family protein [Candidatus Krumholzibacteriota bacterium]
MKSGIVSAVLMLTITVAAPAFAEWQGDKVTRDGVVYIENPESPVEEVRIELEELWRRGGEDDDILFGRVGQVLSDKSGEIYLLDTQLSEIVVLSASGEYLRTIGREGEGPGEFERPRRELLDRFNQTEYMGQWLNNPPSVEGWHTGAEWINSGSLMRRVNFAAELVGNVNKPGIQSMISRLKAQDARSPEQLVDGCLDLMGPMEVAPESRTELIGFAGERCRITASFDVRYLSRRKRDDFHPGLVSVHRVEIVKISTGGSHDDDPLFTH